MLMVLCWTSFLIYHHECKESEAFIITSGIIFGFTILTFFSCLKGNHKQNKNKSFMKIYMINYPVILISSLEFIYVLPFTNLYKLCLGIILGRYADYLWEKCERSFINLFTRFFK